MRYLRIRSYPNGAWGHELHQLPGSFAINILAAILVIYQLSLSSFLMITVQNVCSLLLLCLGLQEGAIAGK
jgi:hypothetical protein